MPLRGADWVLAIDFGTTATAAAIGRDGGAELVGLDGGLPRMLSNVFWQESSGRLLLGDVADNASAVAPWCFERSPKLKLGQEYMLLGDRRVRVGDAVGAVLERVAGDAIRLRGGQAPSEVRLTHPVRWGGGKREALLEAASIAGLDEPRLILEPVAAAMHYAAQELALDQYVAVYDLGGGTLDVAVLQRTEHGFEVVGEPRGREGFGGEEFDHRLYRFLGSQLSDEEWTRLRTEPAEDATNAWPKANRQFQRNVRRAKELLTRNPEVDVDVPSPVNRTLTVSVGDLNSLIRRDVEDSAGELERTIRSAGLQPDQLSAVYLAGGSSQIPLVAEVVQQRIGVVPRYLDDCKAVICLGAALDDLLTRGGRRGASTADRPVLETGVADAAAAAVVADAATLAADAPTLPADADAAVLAADARTLPADADAAALPPDAAAVRPEAAIPTERPTRPEPVSTPTDAATTGESAALFRATPHSGGSDRAAAVHRRRRAAALGGAALLIAVAAVAAVLVAGGSGKRRHPALAAADHPRTARSGPLKLSYEPPWHAIRNAGPDGSVIGRGTTAGSNVTPVQLAKGAITLVAGLLKRSATIPGAVPPQLAAIDGRPEKAVDVLIAGAPGREYIWDTGTMRTVVLVLPTEAGDAALICRGPKTGTEADCRGIAAEVRISGVRLLAPGPPTKFSAMLERALRPVTRARATLGRLSEPTLSKRASRATAASTADARAAREIRRMDTPARYRTTVGRLAGALSTESGRLSLLARAARRGKRSAYARAVRSTDRASDTLAAAGSAAVHEGLKLHVPARLRLAGPPPVHRAQPGHVTTSTTPTYSTSTTSTYTAPTTTYTAPRTTTTYQPAPTQPAPPPPTSSTHHGQTTTPFS